MRKHCSQGPRTSSATGCRRSRGSSGCARPAALFQQAAVTRRSLSKEVNLVSKRIVHHPQSPQCRPQVAPTRLRRPSLGIWTHSTSPRHHGTHRGHRTHRTHSAHGTRERRPRPRRRIRRPPRWKRRSLHGLRVAVSEMVSLPRCWPPISRPTSTRWVRQQVALDTHIHWDADLNVHITSRRSWLFFYPGSPWRLCSYSFGGLDCDRCRCLCRNCSNGHCRCHRLDRLQRASHV